MASRKRQLLDVLRAQHKEGAARAPVELPTAPTPAPVRPAAVRNRSLPPWLPVALRWAFGLAWVVLIVWLIALLWPEGGEPQPQAGAQNPATAGSPAPANPAPPATPAAPAVSDAPRYGILAITYQGTANEKLATSLAIQLRDQLQPQPVQVRKHSEGGKTWYEVFIGQAADKAGLETLLKQVRALSLPDQPGKKPFADAFIKRIPVTTS